MAGAIAREENGGRRSHSLFNFFHSVWKSDVKGRAKLKVFFFSISSDETVDDLSTAAASQGGGPLSRRVGGAGGMGGWRANVTSSSNRSHESTQDITYVPTNMLKSRASTTSLATLQQGGQNRKVRTFPRRRDLFFHRVPIDSKCWEPCGTTANS